MHFALTDDQQEMAGLTREVLTDQCPTELLHRLGSEPAETRIATLRTLWSQLAEVGLPGLLVGEDDGGLGLDEVFLVAVAEEFGRAGLPLPMSDSIVTAPGLGPGSDDPVPTAWADPGGLMPWEGLVQRVLVGAEAYSMGQVRCEPADSIDPTRWLVRCEGADGAGTPLRDPALATARAQLATAAELVGLGAAMVELTVSYVSEREQFGVPIGSFQAVKHHLADSRIAVDFARPAVAEAAWLLSRRGPGDAEAKAIAAQAKLRANEAARLAARWAIQCHGGMGYTTEYDLHLFAKRTWALSATHGTSAAARTQIAEHLGLLPEHRPTLERNPA